MNPIVIKIVLAYLSATPAGEELYCDALAVCQGEQCTVIPVEHCARTYDVGADELSGTWDAYQRTHSAVLVQNEEIANTANWPNFRRD